MCKSRLKEIEKLFKQENIAIPKGFTDEDVNLDAPRLFSDPFYLYFTRMMARTSLAIEELNVAMSDRSNVRSFYKECLNSFIDIYD